MADSLSTERRGRLDYLRSMLAELRDMADADGQQLLAYLIDMAQVEAGNLLAGRSSDKTQARGTLPR